MVGSPIANCYVNWILVAWLSLDSQMVNSVLLDNERKYFPSVKSCQLYSPYHGSQLRVAARNAPGIATVWGTATTTVGCASAQPVGRASTARRCRSGPALIGVFGAAIHSLHGLIIQCRRVQCN